MKPIVGTSARLPGKRTIRLGDSRAQVHAGGTGGFIGGQLDIGAMGQTDEAERGAGLCVKGHGRHYFAAVPCGSIAKSGRNR